MKPAVLVSLLLLLGGCQTVKNATERFSVDRRDALVESLDLTNQSLLDLHQPFAAAKTELNAFGGEGETSLRERHERLSERYVRCVEALENTDAEIRALDNAARRFFLAWESQLFDYEDPAVRDASRLQLNNTRHEYERTIGQVKRTREHASRTQSAFRDYLYFLSHNLNSEAFAALREPGVDLAGRIDNLLKELDAAWAASDRLSSSLRVN